MEDVGLDVLLSLLETRDEFGGDSPVEFRDQLVPESQDQVCDSLLNNSYLASYLKIIDFLEGQIDLEKNTLLRFFPRLICLGFG